MFSGIVEEAAPVVALRREQGNLHHCHNLLVLGLLGSHAGFGSCGLCLLFHRKKSFLDWIGERRLAGNSPPQSVC